MKKSVIHGLLPVYIIVLLTVLALAGGGSKAITTISENAAIKDRQCVIIDAGHGGVDGGATSCTGVLESTLNLEIALRLNDLMHLLGIKTVMVRTTDKSIHTEGESIAAKKVSDLKARVKLANNTENALLISIHQNYFSDPRYSGAQVFYANTAGSDVLAKQLQETFKNTMNPGSNRQAKKSSTGVLIECGFLSNRQEEYKLRSKDYQLNICSVIASVCSSYLYDTVA